ncbi:MAG: LacI family DNA-binding transcriptional regulator [Verrucomicrobiae bacterium]
MKRVTCREIGEKLGLSHSSVSLAMRDHPSLPLATRERVKALADEMGYRPDPALAALNAYRQAGKEPGYQATLGWFNTWPDPGKRYDDILFLGAEERARKLGYGLEEFWAPTPGHWKGMLRTCQARRIEGLLVPPMPTSGDEGFFRDFPWQNFSSVAVGEHYGTSLDLVINNQFQSAARIVRELHALGYRKIGIVMPESFARHTEFIFLGGYLAECAKRKVRPLFLVDESGSEGQYAKQTARWIKEHRPEAVIASGPGDIFPVLREAKMRVPEDIAVAFVSRSKEHPEISCIDQDYRQIGMAGANLLVDLMRRNMRGIPASPMRLLIEGTWVEGTSTPPYRSGRARRRK